MPGGRSGAVRSVIPTSRGHPDGRARAGGCPGAGPAAVAGPSALPADVPDMAVSSGISRPLVGGAFDRGGPMDLSGGTFSGLAGRAGRPSVPLCRDLPMCFTAAAHPIAYKAPVDGLFQPSFPGPPFPRSSCPRKRTAGIHFDEKSPDSRSLPAFAGMAGDGGGRRAFAGPVPGFPPIGARKPSLARGRNQEGS